MSHKTNVLIGAAAAAVLSLSLGACGTHTVVIRQAAQPAVVVTHTATPAPAASTPTTKIIIVQPAQPAPVAVVPAPAYPAPSSYVSDVLSAGIVAPASWIVSTGETICNDWANGETTTDTAPLLQAGGLYAYHDAIFDAITNQDVCPYVNDGR